MNRFIRKRLLSLVLIICMACSLFACNRKTVTIHTSQKASETEKETEKETTGKKEDSTEKNNNNTDGGYSKPVFANGTKTSAEFTEYCNEYFKKTVSENLIDFHYYLDNPSALGITEYSKDFGKVELDKIFDTSEAKEMLDDLKEFNYSKLTKTQQQTYDIIYDALTLEIEYIDYALYSYTFGESFGVQSNMPVLLAEYTLKSEKDVTEYLDLLKAVPAYYKDLMALEKIRAEKKLSMSDELINGVISQCKSFIENPEANYLIDTFNSRIASIEGIDEAKKNEYMNQNKQIVLENIIPAYQYLIDEFTAMLGKGYTSGGITNYKNADKYFEYFLRSSVGTDKTADEVNSLLKKYASSSFTAVTLALAKDSSILDSIDDPAYPVTEPSAIVEDLKSKITNDFPSVPEVTVNLHTVHPSLSEFLSPAFYITSPVDNNKIQNIYINNGADGSFSGLYPTIAHEGYPGHLYQNLYYSTTKHELIRDTMSYTGYCEGWATYVEMMSYSYSGLDKNLATALANYNVYMLCLYGQMDLGLNYYGWSYDELAAFIEKNFGVSDDEIIKEFYNLFLENPGNYLHYVFGYIEIMELKKTASSELGSKFDLKAFHTFLLDFGPAPFYIIEDYMDDWIKTQK